MKITFSLPFSHYPTITLIKKRRIIERAFEQADYWGMFIPHRERQACMSQLVGINSELAIRAYLRVGVYA